MADPFVTPTGGYVGIKFGPVLAGFAGAVVALSYVKPLKPWQMAAAVGTGAVCAAYLTPLACHFLLPGLPVEVQNGIAFLVGVTSMNIVPGLLKLSERFRDNPDQYLPGKGGQ
ncbi:MAG: peptidase M48, Ste24p [Pseudogulbenkiania sp.]|nr:peptidase M48, Ste24p [Pseudogulbenkiania sp.]